MRVFLEYSDIIVHHCQKSLSLTESLYPVVKEKKNVVAPHGDYLIHYREVDPATARREYRIPRDAFVIMNFGAQRPYKNESLIEEIFSKARIPGKYLLVVGKFEYPENMWNRYLKKLRNHARMKNRLGRKMYIYRNIPNSDLPRLMACPDVMLMGQVKGLNSGQLPLAATYGRPVVYPDLGCYSEAVKGWEAVSYTPGNVNEAAKSLEYLYRNRLSNQSLDNTDWLRENSWSKHVAIILGALQG
jgi:hypothetical protein